MPKFDELADIKLQGDIHEENIEEVSLLFDKVILKNQYFVSIDCHDVEYLYSVGIRVLLKYQKLLKVKKGELYLYNLSPRVLKILHEINLLEYLNGCDSLEELKDFLEESR